MNFQKINDFSELAALPTLRYTSWCECKLPDKGSCSVTLDLDRKSLNPNLEAARFGFRFFQSIDLKFDRHLGSSAAEIPVEFQSDTTIMISDLAASILHGIWQ